MRSLPVLRVCAACGGRAGGSTKVCSAASQPASEENCFFLNLHIPNDYQRNNNERETIGIFLDLDTEEVARQATVVQTRSINAKQHDEMKRNFFFFAKAGCGDAYLRRRVVSVCTPCFRCTCPGRVD